MTGFMNERVTGDPHESCFGGGMERANWRERHGDHVEDPFKAFFFFFWKGEWGMRQQLRGIQDQEMITLSEMIYSMAVDCPTGSCREEGLRAEGEGLSAGVRGLRGGQGWDSHRGGPAGDESRDHSSAACENGKQT